MSPLHPLGLLTVTPAPSADFFPETFWPGLLATIIFGVVGIALVVLGLKVFDWLSPKIDVERELAEKNNMAVAVVCAALILGLSYIISHVVR
jgi:putative membrane protein